MAENIAYAPALRHSFSPHSEAPRLSILDILLNLFDVHFQSVISRISNRRSALSLQNACALSTRASECHKIMIFCVFTFT